LLLTKYKQARIKLARRYEKLWLWTTKVVLVVGFAPPRMVMDHQGGPSRRVCTSFRWVVLFPNWRQVVHTVESWRIYSSD